MARTNMESGRINQKLRTRNAILKAVSRLLSHHQNPTIDEIAEAAMVSRTTLYRYFPNLESLIIEASLDIHTVEANQLFKDKQTQPVERVGLVQEYLYDLAVDNETQFRQFIKATMSSWLEKEGEITSLRGGRRIPMLREALAPIEAQLPTEVFDKLVFALSAMVGIESLIVMRDVCELSYEESKLILNWAVKKLVKAFTEEYVAKN